MRKARFIVIVVLSVALVHTVTAGPGRDPKGGKKTHVKGHVIVKFREHTPLRDKGSALEQVSGRKGRVLKRTGYEKVHLAPGWDEERAVEILSLDPSVESVHLDQKVELLGTPVLLGIMPTVMPGDPSVDQQWYLDSPPVSGYFATLGKPVDMDVDIDAPEGWAVMTAMPAFLSTAVVGVIDSGVGENGFFDNATGYDPSHEDLPPGILFTNSSELPANGSDSPADLNDLIDDANGWDFPFGDNTPADDDPALEYHGTLIAGIIGAQWDNGQGVAGIGKGQLEILPLRFTDSFFDIIAAVEYAMDLREDGHDIRVLNMSFKSANGTNPPGLFDVIRMAEGSGIAVVAAAGNEGGNNDDFLNRVWPAEYTRDPGVSNVLAVAATDTTGFLAGFSNLGPNSVQIAAPGDDIYSTYSGFSGYGFAQGTSFSTPIAGAVLGLVMAAHPALTPSQAIDRVVGGGDFDARLAGLVQSGKRVNLAGALAPFAPYSGLVYLDETAAISAYTDSVSAAYGNILSAAIDPSWSTSPAAATVSGAPSSTLNIVPVQPGIAQFTLYFDGVSAPVSTYDTGPWRVTAIRPFWAQVRIGDTQAFQSLLPPGAGDVSWSVMDSTVATIDASGRLTGRSEGITRVILSLDGEKVDYSGWILVPSSAAFPKPSGGGGCGTTFQPGEPHLPGLAEMVLMGTMLLLLRRRHRASFAGPPSRIRYPENSS